MSEKGDFPAARTRKQTGSEGDISNVPAASVQISELFYKKRKTKKIDKISNKCEPKKSNVNKGKDKGKPSVVSPGIEGYFTSTKDKRIHDSTVGEADENILEVNPILEKSMLRRRSYSGKVYTTQYTIQTSPMQTFNMSSLQNSLQVQKGSAVHCDSGSNQHDCTSNPTVTSMPTPNKGCDVHTTSDMQTSQQVHMASVISEVNTDNGSANLLRTTPVVNRYMSPAIVTQTTQTVTVSTATGIYARPPIMGTPYPTQPLHRPLLQGNISQPSNSSTVTAPGAMGTQLMQQHFAGQNTIYTPRPMLGPLQWAPNPSDVLAMQSNILQITNTLSELKQNYQSVEYEQDEDHKQLQKCNQEIQKLDDKLNMASQVIGRQEVEIESLRNHLHYVTTKHMRSELRITGILKKGNQSLTDAVKTFLKDVLKAKGEYKVTNVVRKGEGDEGPVIVSFATAKQKNSMFQFVKNLKGVKNEKEKFYGVSSNLPENEHEADLKKRNIIKANKDLPLLNRRNMSLKKGVLSIDKNVFSNPLARVSASNKIQTPIGELMEVAKVNAGASQEVADKGSIFKGFAMTVNSLEEVQKCYKHFTYKFADATHVMASYLLPGTDRAYDQGYFDDGEHGGGRRLMRILTDSNQYSTLRVVIRYYGLQQLGSKRFDYITQTANEAISALNSDDIAPSELQICQRAATAPLRKRFWHSGPSFPGTLPGGVIRGAAPFRTSPGRKGSVAESPVPSPTPVVRPPTAMQKYKSASESSLRNIFCGSL